MYQQKGLVTRYTSVKYEGPNSYQSKDMANVKVFADKETDKRTGQNYMPPIYRCIGINIWHRESSGNMRLMKPKKLLSIEFDIRRF